MKPRIRTMSMNFFLGGFGGQHGSDSEIKKYTLFLNLNQIAGGKGSPGPTKTWVFLDQREDSINWGDYQTRMEGYGSPPNDEWGIKCRELVAHIHEVDPEGDRYRYPSNRKGIEFAGTSIDVAGLLRAHDHVTTYLDACRSMHSAGYR